MTTDDNDEARRGNRVDKENLKGLERRLQERFYAVVLGLVGSVPANSMLDVGCGEGWPLARMARRFPERSFVGIDLVDPQLEIHWDKLRSPRIEFETANAAHLPFDERRFQMVTALEVLEHVADPEVVMREIRRVCPNGWLVASVPFELPWRAGNLAKRRYVRQFGNTPDHINHWWTPGSFKRFLAAHGTVERVQRPLPWTVAFVRLDPVDVPR